MGAAVTTVTRAFAARNGAGNLVTMGLPSRLKSSMAQPLAQKFTKVQSLGKLVALAASTGAALISIITALFT